MHTSQAPRAHGMLTVQLPALGKSKKAAVEEVSPVASASSSDGVPVQTVPQTRPLDSPTSLQDVFDQVNLVSAGTALSTSTRDTSGSPGDVSTSLSPPDADEHPISTRTSLPPMSVPSLGQVSTCLDLQSLPISPTSSQQDEMPIPTLVNDPASIDPSNLWNTLGPNGMAIPTLPDDFDEEVIRDVDFPLNVPQLETDLSSEVTSLALTPRSATALAHSIQLAFLPHEPAFGIDSIETITLHFDHLTCGILSIKDGPTENPWRTLLWPMAQESQAVFHSVCALAAFHGARHEPRLRITGREHNDWAIQNLHEGLRDDSIGRETRLACSLALGFADGWNHHTTSGNMHIKGARMMIRQALEEHKQTPLEGLRLARLKFLCNAWVYMDVIARITSTDQDETDEYEQIYHSFGNPNVEHKGFGIDFGMGIDAQLDPLMGCAGTLFPLIGRTANLARRVRRSNSNSPAIITQALDLKEQLEQWEPPDFIEEPEDPTSTVPHALQTARAYQWATLLYLHQTVPEIPSATSSQMAKKILQLLATVPSQSRFLIVHIFPLMAAGCEAVTDEDRQWVRDRWLAMGRRVQIGSIDKCLEITEEVWARRDAHNTAPRRPLVPTANAHELAFPLHNRPGRNDSLDLRGSGLGLNNFQPNMDVDMTEGLFPMMMSRPSWPQVREWSDEMNSQYNVSGRLHWLGVMKDWDWEGKLSYSSSAHTVRSRT
ncbi:hypothetical protein CAC42_6582 [Sphaceloma murrayae]|uniref:Uncharacterized protein n=1 Tax=Sphaceloma murrayae TaxID=2082308 RepID=A0A2K1QGP8_9PEZI|nr:hypothetical protein CAC42_6582 [Sphaceloma murrayae]